MECTKENKKRFFRKGGQPHRAQRSFDNHMGSNSCCRVPAPSPSIDSMSLASGTVVTPLNHLQLQQAANIIANHQQQQHHQHLGSLPHLPSMGTRITTSSPCPQQTPGNIPASAISAAALCNNPSTNNSMHSINSTNSVGNNRPHSVGVGGGSIGSGGGNKTHHPHHTSNASSGSTTPHSSNSHLHHRNNHGASTTTNSASLDEAEINMNCHRRFMPAPRRARSAERFDGMRVAYSGGGSGDLPILTRQATDDLMSRSYRSPQILRTVENNASTNVPSGTRRAVGAAPAPPPVLVKSSMDGSGYPVPSPPPSYTTAARDPPPYHQAIAAMKQPTSLRTTQGKPLNNRYTTPSPGVVGSHHQQHHHQQSNSVTSTPTGNHGHGMRSVASTPIFASVDPVCSCHKCQMVERMNDPTGCGTDNDAVYMESQAFLMHEIMTDGMAFCSIM